MEDLDDLLDIYNHIYFKEFEKDPSNFPLLMTQSLSNTDRSKKKMLEIAFEALKVPNFGMTLQSSFAIKALGRVTGIVLDSGYGLTQSVPIVEDYFIAKGAYQSSFLSGNTLNELIQDYISRCKNHELDVHRDFKLLEDIKSEFCELEFKDDDFIQRP